MFKNLHNTRRYSFYNRYGCLKNFGLRTDLSIHKLTSKPLCRETLHLSFNYKQVQTCIQHASTTFPRLYIKPEPIKFTSTSCTLLFGKLFNIIKRVKPETASQTLRNYWKKFQNHVNHVHNMRLHHFDFVP